MQYQTSSHLEKLRAAAADVAATVIAPRASEVDAEAAWPEHSLRALADAGLLGLHVPRRLGGMEQGLLGLVHVGETIGRACSSSAMCFGMHCVGTAALVAKATPDQEERFLRPIAEGRHVTTLALSEPGTGAHFYLPRTEVQREGDAFVVRGSKGFVTNAGHADSYILSTLAAEQTFEAGEFSLLALDADTPGVRVGKAWRGLGMRGNSSRSVELEDVRVPVTNLLGEEGDQIWYVFEVIVPYFLMAMSATYLGIAQAALDEATRHVQVRRHAFSGGTLAEVPVLQHRIAAMWTSVEKSRQLIYRAAELGDANDPQALSFLLSCKADIADVAVDVTNEAMTLCGGIAYGENATLARLLRDARAAHVMAPTTHMLRSWLGRHLLGLPLL